MKINESIVRTLVAASWLICSVVINAKAQNKPHMEQQLIVCNTLSALKQHVGERIIIQGVYHHPEKKRLDQMRILLRDGHAVVLLQASEKIAAFCEANNGKAMKLTGRFYEQLPAKYEEESGTDDPVLIDIEKAELAP